MQSRCSLMFALLTFWASLSWGSSLAEYKALSADVVAISQFIRAGKLSPFIISMAIVDELEPSANLTRLVVLQKAARFVDEGEVAQIVDQLSLKIRESLLYKVHSLRDDAFPKSGMRVPAVPSAEELESRLQLAPDFQTMSRMVYARLMLLEGLFADGLSKTPKQHHAIQENLRVIGLFFNRIEVLHVLRLEDSIEEELQPMSSLGSDSLRIEIRGAWELFRNLQKIDPPKRTD